MKQLEDNNQSFGSILKGLGEKSGINEKAIESQSIKGNHKQVDIFLERMKKNGFNISNGYQTIMKKMCEVSIIDGDENDIDSVFDMPEDDFSAEELFTLQELYAGLTAYHDSDRRTIVFGKFITSVVGDAILHSQEREISKSNSEEMSM